ncbi:MAG: primosomal protein [Caulobacteraceae bacterium]
MPDPDDIEGQDQAEVFDEENITPDGRDIATSDMQRDVYDMTSVDEDADESLGPEEDFDPDRADEAELEEVVFADEDLDEPRSFARDDADLVAGDDTSPADFESDALADDDIEALGYGDEGAETDAERLREQRLDEDLEGTFPASDPFSMSRCD